MRGRGRGGDRGGDHQIFWFEVSVDDVAVMEVAEGLGNLGPNREHLVVLEACVVVHQLVQTSPSHNLRNLKHKSASQNNLSGGHTKIKSVCEKPMSLMMPG